MATPQSDNALRLEDWAKISTNPVTKGLIAALYESDSILKDVPFVEDPSLKAVGVRITPGNLPSVDYGSLNETPDSVRTTVEQHEEKAFLIRENVKMDKYYKENGQKAIVSPIKIQTLGLMEAWSRQLGNDFINNDPTAVGGKKKGPEGLRIRLAAANQAKYGHSSDCLINAAGLSISDSMGKAQALQLFALLDNQLQQMNAPDGTGVSLYMNDRTKRMVSMAGKLCDGGGGFDTTKDNYDRTIETYKNARLRDVGRSSDDVTRIITNTENAGGTATTGSTYTSIYGVRYGGQYVTGWHNGKMDLEYVGKDTSGVMHVWLLDYLFGLYHGHSRTITRSYGLNTQ